MHYLHFFSFSFHLQDFCTFYQLPANSHFTALTVLFVKNKADVLLTYFFYFFAIGKGSTNAKVYNCNYFRRESGFFSFSLMD